MAQIQRDDETNYVDDARRSARRAAVDLAIRHGSPQIIRPAHRGAQPTVRDVDPVAGLRAARDIELGAQHTIRYYILDARERGYSWQYIGGVLNLSAGTQPHREPAAEAAFTYAAGPAEAPAARRYGRSISWRCGACQELILDRGPFDHPAEAERGHAGDCLRLEATIAKWDAQWEAGE